MKKGREYVSIYCHKNLYAANKKTLLIQPPFEKPHRWAFKWQLLALDCHKNLICNEQKTPTNSPSI